MTEPRAAPLIILVRTQMGENIGAAARAMLNCGLEEMRLVAPRDGWPSEAAEAMSSGALAKMPPVAVHDTLPEAIADCRHVYATTARRRDMAKPVMTARDAAADMARRAAAGEKTAILFGPERAGLDNDDVALAHTLITIPLNPAFSSLNLAQGVLLCAYEWANADKSFDAHEPDHVPAAMAELTNLYDRLEDELDKGGFFRSPEMKPTVLRNLKTLLARSEMSAQEVSTFHGVITCLIGRKERGE